MQLGTSALCDVTGYNLLVMIWKWVHYGTFKNYALILVWDDVIITSFSPLFFLVQSFSAPTGTPPEFQPQALQDLNPEAELYRQSQSANKAAALGDKQLDSEPHTSLGLSKKLNGALQRAQSTRGSGRSASAEDLLERSEEKQIPPQHLRSRSSPTGDKLIQVTLTSTTNPRHNWSQCVKYRYLLKMQSVCLVDYFSNNCLLWVVRHFLAG